MVNNDVWEGEERTELKYYKSDVSEGKERCSKFKERSFLRFELDWTLSAQHRIFIRVKPSKRTKRRRQIKVPTSQGTKKFRGTHNKKRKRKRFKEQKTERKIFKEQGTKSKTSKKDSRNKQKKKKEKIKRFKEKERKRKRFR